MATVQEFGICPICQYEQCIEEYYYKEGYITVFCTQCGYCAKLSMVRDRSGQIVYKGDTPQWDFSEQKGKGIVEIKYHKSKGIYPIPSEKQKFQPFIEDLTFFTKTHPEIEVVMKPFSSNPRNNHKKTIMERYNHV